MLSYRTIEPHTLELLKYLMAEPYLKDCRLVGGTALASPKDIAAMKTYAIQNRGSRKDFIDMYFLLQHFTLEEILGFMLKSIPTIPCSGHEWL